MSTTELSGVFVLLVTPLDERRRLDVASLKKLVSYYADAGVTGLTALGEVSESDKLSQEERKESLAAIQEESRGKFPIVVGASRESSELAVEAAQWAEDQRAAAIMMAPPKNPKLREEAIFNYYAAVGDAIRVPIIVQDEPESNHPYLSPELLARINKEIPMAKYLKLEDPPTPAKMMKVRELTNDRMKIFGASHGRYYLWELDRGAVGIMTGSPTPEYLVGIWNAFKRGDRRKAASIFYYNLPLTHFYGEMAVAVKKEILKSRGVIRTAKMKGPARELNEMEREDLVELLAWAEDSIKKDTGLEPLRK